MSHWDGLNRRKFPRLNFPCLVIIKKSQDKDDVFLTHTENVGIGGVSVTLKQDLKIFCPVELELDLLDFEDHIKCQGKVVWNVRRNSDDEHKPLFYDIGIEFGALDPKFQKRLQEAVRRIVANPKSIL